MRRMGKIAAALGAGAVLLGPVSGAAASTAAPGSNDGTTWQAADGTTWQFVPGDGTTWQFQPGDGTTWQFQPGDGMTWQYSAHPNDGMTWLS
jgi:hypothetical protein